MKLAARFLVFLILSGALRAADSLEHARQAQELLGPGVWSQVIRIENKNAASAYPKQLHALVFEIAGILWIYTPADGTQSFSLHRNRLAEEKADLQPLLKAIEPGFVAWQAVPAAAPRTSKRVALPHGCFVESVAALRAQVARGVEVSNPQLLSYYVRTTAGQQGHTVLVYETGEGVRVIDPQEARALRRFPRSLADDPVALARALHCGRVAQARWIPLDMPVMREVAEALAVGAETPPPDSDKKS
ncbi:MAG TPA: hypothetical protein VHO24_21270 [Opitutaceae bacterium]|nr:hypothetical protein [Opitutaceae bacterium]